MSGSIYMNDDETLALVKTTQGPWIVINKKAKIVYGPDKFFTSAKLYLQIMDRKETYEVSKKSS
jgi:hypothetical protein